MERKWKRIFVVGDVHWSQNSSIVRGMGKRYSVRLENLIESVNWAEASAEALGADAVVYLGDFFDRPELNSMEITALREIRWAPLPHRVIVGNHDASDASLEFNSANALSAAGFDIVSEPRCEDGILYLPYITESERKPLAEYARERPEMAFSHNDIRGIRYGAFESKTGFSVGEIAELGALFVNGHLHNHSEFAENAINLGNITGQNFSEDAKAYPHLAMLIERGPNGVSHRYFENPHALNFYKLEYPGDFPLEMKPNAVVSAKARREDAEPLMEALSRPEVLCYRVSWAVGANESSAEATLDMADHIAMFREYALGQLGGDPIAESELSEVLR